MWAGSQLGFGSQLRAVPRLVRGAVGMGRAKTNAGTGSPAPDATRLSPAQLAALLTNVGGEEVTEADVLEDVADGAPTNPDGTLALVVYGAWILKEGGGGG